MLKPGKTFVLSKTTKRMIALMKGSTAEQRNQFKRMMIDAQLCSQVVVKTPTRDKSTPRGTAYVTPETSTTAEE